MKIQFLGQGYEAESPNAIGKLLANLLVDKRFHSFTALTAFTSIGGIGGLYPLIEKAKAHLKNIFIVTGVDNYITPKEALEMLVELNIDAYTFHQEQNVIFHPKIYLFEGAKQTVLIVGSSNFTSKGLFQNVESSVRIDFENKETEGKNLVAELKEYYKAIFDKTDANLLELTKESIEKLMEKEIILTEKQRRKLQNKTEKEKRKAIKKRGSKLFPNRKTPKIPNEFKASYQRKKKAEQIRTSAKLEIKNKPEQLLWESGPLTERDLNIPKNPKTNPTGSMLFKKGRTKNIDQRHHFREVIFSSLDWKYETEPRRKHIEIVQAKFKIIIGAKDEGDFELLLSHDTRTNTTTYKQKNSMTKISWGKAKPIIAKGELIGKSAKLFKNTGKTDEFILVIE